MKRRRGAAAAAAVLKGRKKKGGGKGKKDGKDKQVEVVALDDPLHDFLDAEGDIGRAFGKRVKMLERSIAHHNAQGKVVLEPTEREDVKKQRRIDGMCDLVDKRIDRNSNYTAAFCLIVFFVLTSIVLVQQRDVPQAYLTEGTMLEAMIGDLPVAERGYIKQELTRSDDFYDWFEGQAIDRIFDDPACGNGVCEGPDEYPGFGRFGCIPDCGRYSKTTKITVSLEDFFEYSKSQTGDFHEDFAKASHWDMSQMIDKARDIHPDFRWNIWSDTMGDYIFAETQPATKSGDKVVVDVPDGRNELRFFQYRKVSDEVEVSTIYEQVYMLPSTLPKRTADNDYAYGDKREAIASAAVFMKQMNDYCFGGKFDKTPPKCEEMPKVDTLFKGLGSYGLKGKITKPNPESTEKIPSPITLATAGFCGLLKNGTQGLKNKFNKLAFQAAGVECSNRRFGHDKLVLSQRGRHLLADANYSAALEPHDIAEESHRKLLATKSARYGTCAMHGDCDQTLVDSITQVQGQFCHKLWGCDTCSFCQTDGEDAVNGLCPKAFCPDSGELPGCISALRMMQEDNAWECESTQEFEIWNYHTKGEGPQPVVAPPGQPKVRFVNPYNRLVGPIMITQRRRLQGNCTQVVNEGIKLWAEGGLSDGEGCRQGAGEYTDDFYGLDPAFVPGTDLYDGNLVPEEYYQRSERLNKTVQESSSKGIVVVTSASVPMGFFPYKYDSSNQTFKAPGTYRESEGSAFRIYFDTQISQSQAHNMLSFMKDGGFIDSLTSEIEVQLIAFNAELNRFTFLRFSFDWTIGGSIKWEYWLESIVLDLYDLPSGVAQFTMEIIVVVMLGINILLELIDLSVCFRSNKVLEYVTDPGNLFDWCHFLFFGLSIYTWLDINRLVNAFELRRDAYPVLADPWADARVFTVVPAKEELYLTFRTDILTIATLMRLYNSCAGMTIILFVFRLLKALDFQPIMGIVTRTLVAASFDMIHFVVLYGLISCGFAISGFLIFGHQFYSMRNFDDAFFMLFDIVIAMDTGAFWDQMSHAASYDLFQFYIWGWVILGFFLLINIFMAIIIDSYIAMKEENDSKVGMHEEVMMMLSDYWKGLRLSKKQYMSDSRLYAILLEKKLGLPSTYQLREAVLESLEEDLGIVMDGGIYVNKHSMRRILRGPLEVETDHGKKDGEEEEGALQDSSEDDEDVNWRDLEEECVVEDLMDRYAAGEAGEENQIIDAMRIDGMKRAVALFRHQQWMARKLEYTSEVCERLALRIVPASKQASIAKQALSLRPSQKKEETSSQGLLRVTVIEASGLPRLDLMRSCDPYCLVFLTDEGGEPGEIVYRTEVVHHNSDPVFNEEFLFSLYPRVQTVSVLLYDDDCLDSDDLIGSAQVQLSSLEPWVPSERWCQIRNTAREHQHIGLSKLRLQITLQPANAEMDAGLSSLSGEKSLDNGSVKSLDVLMPPMPPSGKDDTLAQDEIDTILSAEGSSNLPGQPDAQA